MPNGEIIEVEYPDSPVWAQSWSIRYPNTGQIGTTGEQDWEIVERYGLTAILEALSQARGDVAVEGLREALAPFADAGEYLAIETEGFEPSDRLTIYYNGYEIFDRLTFGDFARARALASLPVEGSTP